LWKEYALIIQKRDKIMDGTEDIVNDCILLYKEIKKSLKLHGFVSLDGTEIDDENVSIGIGSDYHTSLITQCKKNGEVIAVNIEIDLEEIVIYGGDLDTYIADEKQVKHKSFSLNQKMEASKYFESLLGSIGK
jgi:hypothetical protein